MSNIRGATGGVAVDSSDEDESSWCSQEHFNVETTLDSFRQQWQEELKGSKEEKSKENAVVESDLKKQDDSETKAKVLFLNGAELERKGKLYEAIQFYRRAVQLVPDIEFKLNTQTKPKSKDYQDSDTTTQEPQEKDRVEEYESSEDAIKGDLLSHIQRKFNNECCICKPKLEQTLTHISSLPMEIILYILRWVVSNELDMRSLEMFSATCRGFYLCCRDSEIWRLACVRTWGVNLSGLPMGFNSWRQVFIERARLRFNGCYISKTTYIRHGENSFQDEFYRPWHLVSYYRYLRFFPEGLVLMLTTPDEPLQCVGQLKHRTSKSSSVLSGHYRLKDDKVTVVVHRHQDATKGSSMYKRNRKKETINDAKQTFHLEMQIQNDKRQKYIQLVWINYSVYTQNRNGTESSCTFEMVNNRFPPLWFSRVKSYTAESYSPL